MKVYPLYSQEPRYAYFIERTDTNAIKIGMSSNPVRRLLELQRIHDDTRLHLLGVLPKKVTTDTKLHKLFEHLRIEGEWFDLGNDLLAFIVNKTTLDLPDIDMDKYEELLSSSFRLPRCAHCRRVSSKSMVAGRDPRTGKTGKFHHNCYSHLWAVYGYGPRPDPYGGRRVEQSFYLPKRHHLPRPEEQSR